MLITPQQLIRLNTLVSKLGIDKETKAEMIHNATNCRETSSAKLTEAEAADLIKILAAQQKQGSEFLAADKMRKKIISMAREIGWHKGNKADMAAIKAWVDKYGYLGKDLNKYTYKELPTLVTQFEKVYTDYLNKV